MSLSIRKRTPISKGTISKSIILRSTILRGAIFKCIIFNCTILIIGLYFAQSISAATNAAASAATNAAAEMDKGMALFNKHDYKDALGYFIKAAKNNPADSTALYYQAVTFHQLKQIDQAKSAYLKIVKNFPGTSAALNANVALIYLDPLYAKQHRQLSNKQNRSSASNSGTTTQSSTQSNQGGGENETASDLASLPDQVRVPYQKEGQNLVITAFVNGRPIDMFFDSGAEGVVIRRSELESLGIKPPSGQHFAMSYGVGDGGGQKTWLARVSLKVGSIERKNFPLHVQEDPPSGDIGHPLLGQTFFRDFAYSLEPAPDGTRGTIFFQKKNANRSFAANDGSVVPFTNMGKDMLVTAEINGRKMQMIFDTGAAMCCFTEQQYLSLGLSIPDDAVQGMDQGIAGTTISRRFTIPRMQLGPIIQTDVSVSVVSNSAIPHPLLGNSFLQDLRIDIDNDSHLMRIRR